MEEYQIWQLWSSNRIGSALTGIGTILAIWLSMRIALNTRNNPETNLLTKIISSAFGIVILAFAWINFTTIANTWIAAARGLSDLKANGTEISTTSEGYIAYVGTIEAAIVDILFIPPMITRATNKLIIIEVIKGSIPKLDSMVLEILSI